MYNNRQQPYFMCEYAHAMGNAVGNLQEYWDAIEGSKYGIGGCVWDWVDQSIYAADDIKKGTLEVNGYNKYRTGYDYPGPHQGNFVNNGLVTADRAWSPELTEVKSVYQYIKFVSFDASSKKLVIKNAYDFISLNAFDLKYTLLSNGVEVENGVVELPAVAPNEQATIEIPYTTVATEGEELLLNIDVCHKEAQLWVEAGYTVASKQYTLAKRASTIASTAGDETLTMSTTSKGRLFKNDNVSIEFATNGTLLSWNVGGNELIASGPEYSNYRWVENDGPTESLNNYSDANGISSKSATFSLASDARSATVKVTASGKNCNYVFTYTIYGNGEILLHAKYTINVKNLRRVGLEMAFPAGMEQVEYYARGPWENYVDRKGGSFLSRYHTTVADMFEPYPKPQSMANREGLRDLMLYNAESGVGVKIQTQGDVAFSLLHYNDTQLKNAAHTWNLEKDGNIYAHFDAQQLGIGNGSCGQGTGALSTYQIPSSGTRNYKLLFTPVNRNDTGVDAVVGSVVTFSLADGVLVCNGELSAGTEVAVYNMGGVLVTAATVAGDCGNFALNVAGQPHGSYIVVVKGAAGRTVHKILL
jgi:beta-galactosidase